jgi:hypothetical protein
MEFAATARLLRTDSRRIPTRGRLRLGVDLVLDIFEELGGKVDANEHDLRVDAVLRL